MRATMLSRPRRPQTSFPSAAASPAPAALPPALPRREAPGTPQRAHPCVLSVGKQPRVGAAGGPAKRVCDSGRRRGLCAGAGRRVFGLCRCRVAEGSAKQGPGTPPQKKALQGPLSR